MDILARTLLGSNQRNNSESKNSNTKEFSLLKTRRFLRNVRRTRMWPVQKDFTNLDVIFSEFVASYEIKCVSSLTSAPTSADRLRAPSVPSKTPG